ncbi:MAG: AIR synthase-related protein, partial [Pseudomonadota bacterium]
EALLEPTRIYVKPLLAAIKETGAIKALAHITGGGFVENIPRVLSDEMAAVIDLNKVSPPPVFGWLANAGGVSEAEMLRTFNCGVGMIAVVSADKADGVLKTLAENGEDTSVIGHIAKRDGDAVVFEGALSL